MSRELEVIANEVSMDLVHSDVTPAAAAAAFVASGVSLDLAVKYLLSWCHDNTTINEVVTHYKRIKH